MWHGCFSTCGLQLWKRMLYHLSYCDQSTRGKQLESLLWLPAGKGLTTWLSFVMLNCVFVTSPCGILGQVWYLIYRFLIFAPLLHCTEQYALSSILFMILLENIVVWQRSNFIQLIHISFKDLIYFIWPLNLTYIKYNRYLFWCQSFDNDSPYVYSLYF